MLSDPSRKTAKAYGLVDNYTAFPKRWTIYVGANGKILHIEKSVKVDTHGADVAAKLAELGVEKK